MKDSAVLLIDCPDRKGLVARLSGLLYECGARRQHSLRNRQEAPQGTD
jgi:formyltetrahydrofolate deformylase